MARTFTKMPPTVLDKLKNLCPDPKDSGACNKFIVAIDNLILARLYKKGAARDVAADMKQDVWLRFLEVMTVPENPIGYMLQVTDSVFNGKYRNNKNRMRLRETLSYSNEDIEKLLNHYDASAEIETNADSSIITRVKKLHHEGFLVTEIAEKTKQTVKTVKNMLDNDYEK